MIRKATTGDIPLIRTIAATAFPSTYRDILSGEQIDYMMEMMYSESSLLRQMTVESNVFYLFDEKGYVSFRPDGFDECSGDVYHLEKLYVLPGFQGQGIGRKLFHTVVEECRKVSGGKCRIELNVNRYNRALSFYEHMGMRRVRQGDFPIGNGYFMNDYVLALD